MTADQFADILTAGLHGPHSDEATAGAARLAAEVIRFLNYATMPEAGGLTEPATVPALMGELSSAAYRLPQLFSQLADWLNKETSAGHLADDHGRPVHRLTDEARFMLAKAMGRADHLGCALAAVQALTTSLHAAGGGEDR
jgi:hypothetical protein